MVCSTQECKSYAKLAFKVLKSKKQPLGKSLQNFLSTFPRTELLGDILTAALYQLAESDPAACRWTIWILKHSDDLQPYFHLIEEPLDLTTKELENQGVAFG